jgi:hypothetical protein
MHLHQQAAVADPKPAQLQPRVTYTIAYTIAADHLHPECWQYVSDPPPLAPVAASRMAHGCTHCHSAAACPHDHQHRLLPTASAPACLNTDVAVTAAADVACRVRRLGREDSATPLTTLGGQQRGLLQFRLKFASESAANSPMAGAGAAAPDFAPNSRSSSAADAQPHPYAAVLSHGPGQPDAIETASEMQDDTLRSINTKTAMAKAAMQQLNAELAELTGTPAPAAGLPSSGSGSSSRQPASSRGAAQPRRSVGEAPNSSPIADKAQPRQQQQLHQGRHSAEAAAMSPVSASSSGVSCGALLCNIDCTSLLFMGSRGVGWRTLAGTVMSVGALLSVRHTS